MDASSEGADTVKKQIASCRNIEKLIAALTQIFVNVILVYCRIRVLYNGMPGLRMTVFHLHEPKNHRQRSLGILLTAKYRRGP